MKKIKMTMTAIASAVLLSGCAANGQGPQTVGEGVDAVIGGIGQVAGGFLQPYTNGTKVTADQLAQLDEGMSQDDVELILGYPPEIKDVGGKEVWSYPYTEIPHFGANINETTIVRFDGNGKLAKAYKSSTRTSSSGNPLVDAANGTF